MIKHLCIQHYAIIDNLELDFEEGFSVFTGETGAGKSIIMGALSLLEGERADSSIITHGQNKCMIEGIFSTSSSMKKMLSEAEIECNEDTIVRRIIENNRSSIRVNGCSVTLSFLQKLFEGEMDIHSQRDSQYLLKKQNHLILLDGYRQDHSLDESYQKCYLEYRSLLKEFDSINESEYNPADMEFARFSLNELQNANLQLGEEDELKEQEKRFKSSEKIIESLNECVENYDQEDGLNERFYRFVHDLNVDDREIENIRKRVEELFYSLEDEVSSLRKIRDSFETGDMDMDAVQERLYVISKLKRKYNRDADGLLTYQKELEEKVAFYEDREEILQAKKKALDAKRDELVSISLELRKARLKAAEILQNKVVDELEDLKLKNVRFEVEFNEKEPDANGMDDVEFCISLNKGENPKPLVKIASGGELSRLMLGLKAIFSRISSVGLLVFDEIDSGVSGAVAFSVGLKMANIAQCAQVLAITHIPQVAACGDYQYFIHKEDDEHHTFTQVSLLNESDRVGVLADLSSNSRSESALMAAKELLDHAQEMVHSL